MKKTDFVDAHVGQQIKALRTSQGITQPGLAEKLGVTFQQLQKYENGTNRVTAGRLYIIARELGTRVNGLYAGLGDYPTDPDAPSESEIQVLGTRELLELAKSYQQLGQQERTVVRMLVRTMAQ